jgi:hypothetical protein
MQRQTARVPGCRREIEPHRAAGTNKGLIKHCCGEGELAELWQLPGPDDARFGELVVRAR